MTYGANLPNNYRQFGTYAGRILKGEKVADLPIMHPAKFDFVITLLPPKLWALKCRIRCSRPPTR